MKHKVVMYIFLLLALNTYFLSIDSWTTLNLIERSAPAETEFDNEINEEEFAINAFTYDQNTLIFNRDTNNHAFHKNPLLPVLKRPPRFFS